MFSLPPLPTQDKWSLPVPEEGPWLGDTASVLQPKALLPTPRYCQPPPTYRPRPPLFPVPPPGSCLLPPPPLPTCDGVVSPHSWHEVTPGKADRWRKMSWTAGDGGSLASPPPTYYNYQRQAQARPRTLVEVPLQPQPGVLRSDPKPIQSISTKQQPLDILQSNLDPNSRPFTPAGLQSFPSSPLDSVDCATASTSDVAGNNFSYFDNRQSFSFEACSDISLSYPPSNTSRQESLTSKLGSIFADDPLPDDPKIFLPELENSHDMLRDMEGKLPRKTNLPFQFPPELNTILPPPILPFAAHWSSKSRPPLLPTPKNFPPFGPRPIPAPIYEEDFPSSNPLPAAVNPLVTQLHPFSFPGPTALYKSKIEVEEVDQPRRKPDVVSRIGNLNSTVPKSTLEHLAASNPIQGNYEALTSTKNCQGVPDNQDWDPSFPTLEPSSLLDPHPVPDEYMVAKVIGGKLPPIKLPNCHTDLLLFLFYAWQEDTTQLVAASLLFERGWRYHTVDKVWLARWPGVTPEKKTTDWEEGLYQYFDVKVWRRIPGWFRLNYVQLAEKTDPLKKETSQQALNC